MPESEFEETEHKAAALKRAIELAAESAWSGSPGRSADVSAAGDDPASGGPEPEPEGAAR